MAKDFDEEAGSARRGIIDSYSLVGGEYSVEFTIINRGGRMNKVAMAIQLDHEKGNCVAPPTPSSSQQLLCVSGQTWWHIVTTIANCGTGTMVSVSGLGVKYTSLGNEKLNRGNPFRSAFQFQRIQLKSN